MSSNFKYLFLEIENQFNVYESNLISNRRAIKDKKDSDDEISIYSDELELFKKELSLNAKPKQDLFRNNNLSKACLIQ